MNPLTAGLGYVDLNFQGVPGVIATVVLHGDAGVALIDPGPSTTLGTLTSSLATAGIAIGDVNALLLTHIHLDHAGAAGTLVRQNPRLRVYVHERGAPHMIDPARLVASAERLYGADMDRLWGEVRPVPAEAIVALGGGERLSCAGRELEVAYTPGHAAHHVSYFSRDSGIAFVGDTTGVCLKPDDYVVPATPPPDIDLEIWAASLRTIESWGAESLFVTHFGPLAPVRTHLRAFADHLDVASRLVRGSLEREGNDAEREAWFVDQIRRELRRHMGDADARIYEVAGRFDLNWRGLARYWRKKMANG